ncbi:preprotein translocase subunit SecY [Candidatus Falkowbacteria bacterium]|nr:preprotein translocase subunit SecY [Patescibacteria group bacterium]MDD3434900.1 preprotein translocase subunit SecY [Patescibacteria group bacterium]MDD4466462.1 preprotein translocase subunit SecY [Patescibacteria group bacterium]NCU43018.1 preprotein translocase subunit SecY [Candidatus Falkowbacteria bacterium]
MFEKLARVWKVKELRNSILFVLAMLAVFRLFAHIPIPGIDASNLRSFFANNPLLGFVNMFSGGGMERFSVVMMGIGPYITSSIIFQLLGMIVPKLEEMQKEESGRQKINMWTRWATVPLSIVQAFGMLALLRQSNAIDLSGSATFDIMAIVITITAGTILLMWIGELISEKKIGNGISLLIFAGIIASLPQSVSQMILTFDQTQIFTVVAFALLAIITIVGVVIVNEGQRNIPIQYARQIRGNRAYGGTNSHLPLRVNMAGVIPIIFALAVATFPTMIAQYFQYAKTEWIANFSQWIIITFNNQLVYGVLYFVLVFAFTYFYTDVVFHPDRISENLQKQGGFIPGIRPGKQTAEYIGNTSHKIIFFGALFLAVIAVLPLVVQAATGVQSMIIGGTSILIVVSVVIDTIKQMEAQLTMREYDGV